jgi:hypothetical protein
VARLVRLDKLRGLARLYADQRPGGANAFVPDTGGTAVGTLTDLINLAGAEFWDLLVQAHGPSFVQKTGTVAIVANTSSYSLPADFYLPLSVQLEWATNDHEPVDALDGVDERSDFQNWPVWGRFSSKAYRLLGGQSTETIEFSPMPTSAVTARLYYVPTWTDLVNDTDSVNCVNGWEKVIALRAAIELRSIEEQPAGDLAMYLAQAIQRVEQIAADRASSQPKRVRQVYPEGGGRRWPYVRRPLP